MSNMFSFISYNSLAMRCPRGPNRGAFHVKRRDNEVSSPSWTVESSDCCASCSTVGVPFGARFHVKLHLSHLDQVREDPLVSRETVILQRSFLAFGVGATQPYARCSKARERGDTQNTGFDRFVTVGKCDIP